MRGGVGLLAGTFYLAILLWASQWCSWKHTKQLLLTYSTTYEEVYTVHYLAGMHENLPQDHKKDQLQKQQWLG